jgi:menaquinone-dependent protoporphyrinogen oxidase
MMRVLVAAAGRHGATAEIAETIGGELTKEGMKVDVVDVDDVHGLGDYDAVVLGSAVYMGHWLKSAAAFAASRSAELRARQTWLFSSGPVGDPPRPGESDAVNVKAIVAATGATEHRLFAGKLDKRTLNFRERAVMRAVGGYDGDYRDWNEIRAWAEAIAMSLNAADHPGREPTISTGKQPIGRQRAPS